ncbi:hypothetical protein D9615_004654 [Tricholomella constricta]|uniref:Matrin-type domain-containing protein n=1 Tax=Tricholomella constricta TaxID=117010 RepID=A0A8H5M458_9AGAR|nr:hypothetical protein D9615_004654 [Tricholomella constricta]
MSEYWVSKKKYFCKYCDIYIADDAPSRQQHENGLRHKGNVERFIRGLYKVSEKRKKDQDEEKRDMARVEQAAQAAYAQDVAAGLAKPGGGPVASTSSAVARQPAVKPANPFVNYSTAESLGFSDPDAERYAAESERRRTQGVAGEWEVVATIPSAPKPTSDEEVDEKPDIAAAGDVTGVKREAEAPPDEEDTRQYKLRKKTWAGGLGEVYDPGAIPIKLKKKEEVEIPPADAQSASTSTSSGTTKPTDAPKWTKVQWRRPGEAAKEALEEPQAAAASSSEGPAMNIEDAPAPGPIKSEPDALIPPAEEQKPPTAKTEKTTPPLPVEEAASTSGMFRKRKLPAGGNRGRRS